VSLLIVPLPPPPFVLVFLGSVLRVSLTFLLFFPFFFSDSAKKRSCRRP